jgi:hypothetical protein
MTKIVNEIIELIANKTWPDFAPAFHANIGYCLKKNGFDVSFEFLVRRVNGRRGRIDLVATKADESVAIELDNKMPRIGSLEKLRLFEGSKMVILREGEQMNVEGIDAVVAVRVRPVTPAEHADRRTVRRYA